MADFKLYHFGTYQVQDTFININVAQTADAK